MIWFAIALGGAIGSVARHFVGQLTQTSSQFPLGITLVNVSGCFVIGVLAGLLAAERIAMPLPWREFVFVGLLGGFTTFSTFGLDTFTLIRSGAIAMALLTLAAQVLGGLLAVSLGYRLGLSGI